MLQIPFQTHLQKSIFVLVGQGVGEKDEEDVTTALTIDVPKVQIHNDVVITLNFSSFRSKEGLSVIIWRSVLCHYLTQPLMLQIIQCSKSFSL